MCCSEDELSSDSSEYEPPLDDQEALRLAESWRRRHPQHPLTEPSDLYESDGCDRNTDGTYRLPPAVRPARLTWHRAEPEALTEPKLLRFQEVAKADKVAISKAASAVYDRNLSISGDDVTKPRWPGGQLASRS